MTLQYERQRYDGWYNNLAHPGWGTVDSHLVRKTPPSYADGVYMMSGGNRCVSVTADINVSLIYHFVREYKVRLITSIKKTKEHNMRIISSKY